MSQTKKILFLLLTVFIFSGCQSAIIKLDNAQITEQEQETKEVSPPSNSIKFGVITDIHKCEKRSPGKITKEKLASFVSDVDSRNVDFIVDLGDNARYRMSSCNDDASEDLTWVIDNLKTSAPLYHALSDHDVDDIASFEFWKKTTGTEKTFYSFDVKDFHIIVLDTVSGDGQLDPVCENYLACQNAKKEYEKRRDLLKNDSELDKYLAQRKISKEFLEKERAFFEERYTAIRSTGKEAALIEKRDKGSILPTQLDWIKEDLAKTDKDKVIIFSDHPLFSYQGKRKLYEIVGLEQLTETFTSSGKQIVSISGETHEWHEEKRDGIQFYLIGIFSGSPIGAWAIIDWDEDGTRLERVEK